MCDEFEKKVSEFCRLHGLFSDGDTVLAALSGGGDSVCLLTVLVRLKEEFGITVEAAHFNHSLRGDESDRDEVFCRELCSRMNIHLTVLRIPEGELARRKGSLETAAREARIAFLEHTCAARNLNRIATGHTLDDQAETVLQRILRGTGPAGLRGILPSRDAWVRPLLWAERSEIRRYLSSSGIGFREDSSNTDTAFFRNRIRLELMPLLERSFSPNIRGCLTRLAELSATQENFLLERMMAAFHVCCIHADAYKILLDKPAFMGYHKVLRQRMVRYCLEKLEGAGRDTDMDEVETILDRIADGSEGHDITAGIHCEAGDRTVTFAAPVSDYGPVPLNIPGETVIPGDGGVIVSDTAAPDSVVDGRVRIRVSTALMEKYGNLTIGQVKRGEFMTPFGLKRPVKIRDIMSSVSLPKVLRRAMPVVRAGAMAVWIPGLKSSEYLRIDEKERNGKTGESIILRLKNGLQWPSEARM
ncbi:tRNA lysidine(34) synthetase TilS [bacterium]|nr:tRNA lysidine(34) synthetase TilS [bacterium]